MFIQWSSSTNSSRGRLVVHGRPVVVALWSSRGPWSPRGRPVVFPWSSRAPWSPRGRPWSRFLRLSVVVSWSSCGRHDVVPRSFRGRPGVAVLLWSVVVPLSSRGTWSSPCSVIAQRSFVRFRVRTFVTPGSLHVSVIPGYTRVSTSTALSNPPCGRVCTLFHPLWWSLRCIWVVVPVYPLAASWSPLSMLWWVFSTAWGNQCGRGFRPPNIPRVHITRQSALLPSERVRMVSEVRGNNV